MGLFTEKVDWRGRHCLVTGGSQGLGKEVARLLVTEGCHVTILARSATKLESTLKEIGAAGVKVNAISADVSNYGQMHDAVERAVGDMDGVPISMVFCCAGSAKPGFFLEQESADFDFGVKVNYLGSLYTVHAVAKSMISHNVHDGKIVLVGSTLSLIGIAGYAQYAPAKAALRNLAECLRQEFLMYGISVHLYCPGSIDTPGFEEEQKIKPKVTKAIEGQVALLKPERCAAILLSKLKKRQFIITSDFDTDLLRCATIGIAPRNNYFMDGCLQFISSVKYPRWTAAPREVRATPPFN